MLCTLPENFVIHSLKFEIRRQVCNFIVILPACHITCTHRQMFINNNSAFAAAMVITQEGCQTPTSILLPRTILLPFIYKLLPNVAPSNNSPYLDPLNPELNPICYLLTLLAHHFLHVSRIKVKSLTLR